MTDFNPAESMADRIARIQDRIASACERAGRSPDAVQLIAVSKTRTPDEVRQAAACGLRVFGENKVQEARAKIPMSPGHLSWHLIGHLQTNKARHAVQLFEFIHSVDSLKIMEALHQACEVAGRRMPVCLEVNVGGEASKFGISPDELPSLLEASAGCNRLDVVGLMCIPPIAEDPERTRGFFRTLRGLKERAERDWGFPLAELSMGMSSDFELAIEEGSTMVRIGTELFGPREKK